MTYTRLNDFKNAREYYQKAATLNSLKNISNLNLGQICLIFREYDEAERYFYKCISCDDEKIQANSYLYLAKIQMLRNDTNKAIQYANLAIEIDPNIIRKIEYDYTFTPILAKLKVSEHKNAKSKLNNRELEIIDHLGKTYNVVENLTDAINKMGIDKDREK